MSDKDISYTEENKPIIISVNMDPKKGTCKRSIPSVAGTFAHKKVHVNKRLSEYNAGKKQTYSPIKKELFNKEKARLEKDS